MPSDGLVRTQLPPTSGVKRSLIAVHVRREGNGLIGVGRASTRDLTGDDTNSAAVMWDSSTPKLAVPADGPHPQRRRLILGGVNVPYPYPGWCRVLVGVRAVVGGAAVRVSQQRVGAQDLVE